MDTYKRSIRGLQSRSNGEHFEGMIIAASRFYEERGIAAVDKTPEAFKVLKAMDRNRGQFICCFTKQAQPDFKGILMDSTMILFDAKHTDKDKISRDVVTAEQQACFERYMKLGAMCFLVVSLEFKEFYRVPWVVFRDMKKIYGHKYMNREELEPYCWPDISCRFSTAHIKRFSFSDQIPDCAHLLITAICYQISRMINNPASNPALRAYYIFCSTKERIVFPPFKKRLFPYRCHSF